MQACITPQFQPRNYRYEQEWKLLRRNLTFQNCCESLSRRPCGVIKKVHWFFSHVCNQGVRILTPCCNGKFAVSMISFLGSFLTDEGTWTFCLGIEKTTNDDVITLIQIDKKQQQLQ